MVVVASTFVREARSKTASAFTTGESGSCVKCPKPASAPSLPCAVTATDAAGKARGTSLLSKAKAAAKRCSWPETSRASQAKVWGMGFRSVSLWNCSGYSRRLCEGKVRVEVRSPGRVTGVLSGGRYCWQADVAGGVYVSQDSRGWRCLAVRGLSYCRAPGLEQEFVERSPGRIYLYGGLCLRGCMGSACTDRALEAGCSENLPLL
jgi:hypothetical protein